MAGSYPSSASSSFAAWVSSTVAPWTAIWLCSRFILMSTIRRISLRSSLWKTMISSIRFRSSGRKTFLSSPMTRDFMSS